MEVVFVLFGLVFILFIILSLISGSSTSTSTLKGLIGEEKTTRNMQLSLNAKIYQRYHDVILPSSNGTTQIDHLLVSLYGLFIVETKNIKGWIFGSEDQPNWTQSLYGKITHYKIRFARLSGKKRSSLNS